MSLQKRNYRLQRHPPPHSRLIIPRRMQSHQRARPSRLHDRRTAMPPIRPAVVHQRANLRILLEILARRIPAEAAGTDVQHTEVGRDASLAGLEILRAGMANTSEGGPTPRRLRGDGEVRKSAGGWSRVDVGGDDAQEREIPVGVPGDAFRGDGGARGEEEPVDG